MQALGSLAKESQWKSAPAMTMVTMKWDCRCKKEGHGVEIIGMKSLEVPTALRAHSLVELIKPVFILSCIVLSGFLKQFRQKATRRRVGERWTGILRDFRDAQGQLGYAEVMVNLAPNHMVRASLIKDRGHLGLDNSMIWF